MITLIATAIVFYILYLLFVRGVAWGLLFFVGGVIGIRLILLHFLPQSVETLLTISGYTVSYATVGAVVISVLGIGYFLQAGEK